MLSFARACARCVVKLNASFAGQTFYRRNEVEMFNLLNEREHIAFGATPKAHVTACLVVHAERWRSFRMEWTQTNLPAASPTKLGIWRHDV